MNGRVIRSRAARADLDQIWDFIAEASESRADAFIRRLTRTFETLAGRPLIGRARDNLGTGVRSIPVGAYLIFYRPIEGGVEIVRVLHGARDYAKLF